MLPFLADLDVTEDERAKLASLGASSPLALLSMRKASAQAFDALIGPKRSQEIADQLTQTLTQDERALLGQATQPARRFGARLPGKD